MYNTVNQKWAFLACPLRISEICTCHESRDRQNINRFAALRFLTRCRRYCGVPADCYNITQTQSSQLLLKMTKNPSWFGPNIQCSIAPLVLIFIVFLSQSICCARTCAQRLSVIECADLSKVSLRETFSRAIL